MRPAPAEEGGELSAVRSNIIVIATLAALAMGFTFGLMIPGFDHLDGLRTEAEQEAESLRTDQAQVGDVSSVYASIVDLDEELSDFRQRLPASRRLGSFLSRLSELFMDVGVSDYAIQPRPAMKLSAEALPEPAKRIAGTSILPVQISFDAEFKTVHELLERVEVMSRLVHVETMNLSTRDDGDRVVHVDLVLHTYFQPE